MKTGLEPYKMNKKSEAQEHAEDCGVEFDSIQSLIPGFNHYGLGFRITRAQWEMMNNNWNDIMEAIRSSRREISERENNRDARADRGTT